MSGQPTREDLRQQRVTAAIRSLGYLLLDLDPSRDDRLMRIINLKADLTDNERATLLSVVLSTFTADQAEDLVKECFGTAGIPIAGLTDDVLPEARHWASDANPAELGAYVKAGLEKMSNDKLKAVAEWIGRKVA